MIIERKSDEQIRAERHMQIKREIARMDYEAAMDNRFAKGFAEGFIESFMEKFKSVREEAIPIAILLGEERGRDKATEEHALAFIQAGLSKDMVFKTLKMSDEKIAEFLNKYKDL